MKMTVGQLAKRIGAQLIGDDTVEIEAVSAVESSNENNVTFLTTGRYKAQLDNSCACAVILAVPIKGCSKSQLVVEDVNAALIESLNIFAPKLEPRPAGIDSAAKVSEDAEICQGVFVGPYAVIEAGVKIGENTVISGGCKISENTQVGSDCRLDHNVVVYHNCTIGNNVIIQANSTIGSTGFGYAHIAGKFQLIPHNGTVVIEDFVEIGANSCIDRAKFGQTRIGAGTKIDNLVQIAHNVKIGKCCLIAGQAGIAGSSKVGDGVIFGGSSGASDNLEIGAGAVIGGRSAVFSNLKPGQQVFGTPATEKSDALKAIALTRRLPKLFEELKQLRLKVKKLETSKDDKK